MVRRLPHADAFRSALEALRVSLAGLSVAASPKSLSLRRRFESSNRFDGCRGARTTRT